LVERIVIPGDASGKHPLAIPMRVGACEYVDREKGNEDLLEAFTRFSAGRGRVRAFCVSQVVRIGKLGFALEFLNLQALPEA